MKLARLLGRVGRVLITAGLLILAFVAYQLWGTGLQTARAQNSAEDEFERLQEEFEEQEGGGNPGPERSTTTTSPEGTPGTTPTTAPEDQPEIPIAPPEGEIAGRVQIPSIGVDWIFYEGVDLSVLQNGPGHYQGTPLPGQPGNAGIAGHRTTYGAPFNRLDEMKSGDEIEITYITGATFTYEYRSTEIVSPNQVDVRHDKGDNRLTLTACHPKYSARERIVVIARLADEPAPAAPQQDRREQPQSFDNDTEAPPVSKVPAVLWGVAAGMIWLAAWFVGRAWRRWPSYVIAFPAFAVALFVFFDNFYKLLPAGF
ncbi:MAG TPA: class E sortase [Acidimicrobiales bacterium]|nr:class E sortase [Acidimicrobiales bacterium]